MSFATVTFDAATGATWDTLRSVLDGWGVAVSLPGGLTAHGVVDAHASLDYPQDVVVLRDPNDRTNKLVVPLDDGVTIQVS